MIFIVVPWLYLGNSQVSVYRTIGPTLVSNIVISILATNVLKKKKNNSFKKKTQDVYLNIVV